MKIMSFRPISKKRAVLIAIEPVDDGRIDTTRFQMGTAFRFVKQPQQAHAGLVVDAGDHIGGLDVVDPGHVLVADTFDAV